MKTLLSLVTILTAYSIAAAAQSTQAPPMKPILSNLSQEGAVLKYTLRCSNTTIIRSHNKNYRLDSVSVLKMLKKEWISDYAIKRDTSYTTGKGYDFQNTTIITLKDDAYPEAFTTLKQSLIAI